MLPLIFKGYYCNLILTLHNRNVTPLTIQVTPEVTLNRSLIYWSSKVKTMEKENIALDESGEFEEEEKPINLDKGEHIIVTTVAIPKDLLKQLGYIAVEEGVSRGEIIRRCIKEYLAGHNPKSKEDAYTGKVEKVKELVKTLEKQEMEVKIDAEDLYPENIDATIEQLEKAITESET